MLGDDGIKLCINLDVPIELVTSGSRRGESVRSAHDYRDSDVEAISGTCSNWAVTSSNEPTTTRGDPHPTDELRRDTEPLLSFYGSRGLLVSVNGDQSPRT